MRGRQKAVRNSTRRCVRTSLVSDRGKEDAAGGGAGKRLSGTPPEGVFGHHLCQTGGKSMRQEEGRLCKTKGNQNVIKIMKDKKFTKIYL